MILVESSQESPVSTTGSTDPDLPLADPAEPMDAVVYPAEQSLSGEVTAQPSKNYASRLMLAAALANGESVLGNCATSDDARAMQRCLQQMGAQIELEQVHDGGAAETLRIRGFGGAPRLFEDKPVNVGNAGAVLRLLLGTGALLPEIDFETTHTNSLGKRPNEDLLEALAQLGCHSESSRGTLPIRLHGGHLRGGRIQVSGARSSQFLSSLLFLAPLVGEPVVIEVTGGLVSKAPVRQTLEVLSKSGIVIQAREDLLEFHVEPQEYQSGASQVNGDWPGSAALLAAAAVTGGEIAVHGLYPDEQGEKESLNVLERMGCKVSLHSDGRGAELRGNAQGLRAVEFDGDLATDAVLALMGAACLARGRTRFYNVANLRIKECDRISEPIAELRKLGVRCWEGKEVGDFDPDAVIIEGNPDGYDGGGDVDGRGDHRVIMLLSIVGLRCRKPIRITGAHHVAKSYPAYFRHLSELGGKVRLEKVHQ